ncbi:MAG: haloacid dehalogenase [Gammaproteobacteria bacterium]|jgi:translin|nr:haloacid dehalogenase [Gammaproteobacteria bacterium]
MPDDAFADETDSLNPIADGIREVFTAKNAARDDAIARSRELIRHCSEGIRAIHRRNWKAADEKLDVIRAYAAELKSVVEGYPDLLHSGYTQDALKEVTEAFATYAIIRRTPLPTLDSLADLGVGEAAYLKGLAEAATELRRFILDILRRENGDSDEAERLLAWMDAIYDRLVTFDFPDALTGGLRRQTDVVRGVLERTRGDLTTTLRQQRLQAALQRFEARVLDSGKGGYSEVEL